MEQVISEIISALLQIILFALIPFLVFVIKNKTVKGFLNYIGLTTTSSKAISLSIIVSLIFIAGTISLVFFNEHFKTIMVTPPSVTGKLHQMGLNTTSIIVLLIIACFKTSLAEEIFFRGFIAKQLMKKLGYLKGNILQSVIFATLHLLLFSMLTKSGLPFLLFIFTFSGIAAFIIGYIKEKFANGSIVPGWIGHGLGNTISYFIIAFIL